ncbi:hypothetical protein EA848_14935 [Vibrio anguillarum]|uniref:hypothetical protein n=1 Tax=Vibrio anguillarum TaxID=55601 RepID=UPI00188A528F|nr:hypothetical protein [Vibrio anguillarum]MBF4385444.1 hypothetical protein [Vibrio anguillarum]MBF4395119.1 hypothetical protein [Vibrio anguillarum]MBF4430901.1 hypothetical protein [Vibrio anguillarum]
MFKRQILISDASNVEVSVPNTFRCIDFTKYSIYFDSHNKVYQYIGRFFSLLIVGEIVHPQFDSFDLRIIVNELDNSDISFPIINKSLSRCCGRYYLFYSDSKVDMLRADATSLAQINFSSSYGLIATDISLLQYQSIKLTHNEEAYKFYKEVFPKKGNGNAWIGHETIFNEIEKVLPNHALSIRDMKVVRYWPQVEFKYHDINQVVTEVAEELKAILKSFSEVSPLSIAVTAGNDSRVMAAATKEIKHRCYYFIDKLKNLNDDHPDIVIGKRICDTLGVKYTIHTDFLDVDKIPDSFKNEYSNSVFYATEKRLPEVYNYSIILPENINVCGVGEFGRSVYGTPKENIESNYLCFKYQCVNSRFSNFQTNLWLAGCKEHLYASSYPKNSLYYIEQKLGNWGAVGNSESDIAFEEVNPFATHYIIERMICLPYKYTKYYNNILFKEIIHYLAPEISCIPINPPRNFKGKIVDYIKSGLLFNIIERYRYITKNIIGNKVA